MIFLAVECYWRLILVRLLIEQRLAVQVRRQTRISSQVLLKSFAIPEHVLARIEVEANLIGDHPVITF